MSVRQWISFTDRQNVCQAMNFVHWQTKCLSGNEFRPLTDKMSVSILNSFTDRQNVCQAMNFVHWQTKSLSVSLNSLIDRWNVCQCILNSFTDRRNVCHAPGKNGCKWLGARSVDRHFVCQWYRKIKKTEKKSPNALIDRPQSVSATISERILHALTDISFVKQWI